MDTTASRRRHLIWMLAATLGMQLLASCNRQPPPTAVQRAAGLDKTMLEAAREPVDAVLLPTARLRANDLPGFARITLPPVLLEKVSVAWQQGRTRWPLDELPFDEKVPELLGALSAPDAETRLRRTFNRQFANQAPELKSAATALGLFGTQYIAKEGEFGADERAHYARLIQALSQWASGAPLADRKHAEAAIARLTVAARNTRLHTAQDFSKAGMQASLQQLSPFVATLKQVLATYGLDLDASLSGMQVTERSRDGDRARVAMQYTLAGTPVEAEVDVERIDGHWYLSDFLRNASSGVDAPPIAPPAP